MSIKVFNNKIVFQKGSSSYTLEERSSGDGLKLNGNLKAKAFTPSFQGNISGYSSGADVTIDKFPFASDGNATDVGDLTQSRDICAGQSSSESGYNSGGNPAVNTIDKFPFASDGNATDVGDLTQSRYALAGQSSSVSGYSSGGKSNAPSPTALFYNTIDKFPFSADANATDVGNLTQARLYPAGQSSSESGYNSGGFAPPLGSPSGAVNIIDKFPFESNANATDVGDLFQTRLAAAGQSSDVSGYSSGGVTPSFTDVIDKFPFSTDANATDVGNLTQARRHPAGQSSTESGYSSGGMIPQFTHVNTIDKFPFSVDANATDVGDLTVARSEAAGQQI